MIGKYHLIKNFWIACAHQVYGAGKCERVHGHNYKVTFCIEGTQLDEQHMLIDYRVIKEAIINKYDHHLLNEFPEFNPELGGVSPTTERVAEIFFVEIDRLCKEKSNHPTVSWIEVQETEEATVRFERMVT
ncbi:6-pyruvoyl trahydropterin synthase family protein [Shimazuella kribbensis]|uniref:6-pyruvoyl trahydropterin synthase family protein n=1 Tax=Shimazuella kribbensis TaxID=139808 RepID=UPI000411FD51|nr:6-carboxytetrahydropterin synthase [Shimazuella kribbensis]